jgi:N-acetyl-gamma-glutamylphosphate reductase
LTAKIPALVLGGTGYVAGELLRLIAGHPQFDLAAVLSDSQPGERVGKSFPHLASAFSDTTFSSQRQVEKLIAELPQSALFSAAPHGVSAALIDSLLKTAEGAGTKPRVVDISADFRYSDPAAYEAVYKHPHGAPQRQREFTCSVPEHLKTLTCGSSCTTAT